MKKLVFLFMAFFAMAITAHSQSYIGYMSDKVDIMDSTGKVIVKRARKGDGVLVYTLQVYQGKKYKIHHINSSKDGYIFREDVLLEKSVPYTAQTLEEIKQAIRDTEMRDPLLKMYNNTDGKLTFKFGKEQYELNPKERVTVKLTSGKYYYKLKTKGYDPYYGVEILENHRLYDWEFYLGK
jgi:hypothetical protein